PDGEKMSKSKGNVVDPNEVVEQYGADVLRLYVLFMGDYEKAAPWSENSVRGCKRFIDRLWALQEMVTDEEGYSPELEGAFHRTIKKVSEDFETLKYNTAIAAMMTLLNEIYDKGSVTRGELKTFITLLNPVAPHITEEIFEQMGFGGMLNESSWPTWDDAKCVEKSVEIVVQVNGKIRARLNIAPDMAKEDVLALAKADEKVAAELAGKTLVKELYIPAKLVNLVIRP
ncbi:MAG: class I tRNA ligase family protein, partial [Clostridia bacterium]|nr:class I tRNA ligase family protein [Clostridia bacterium]